MEHTKNATRGDQTSTITELSREINPEMLQDGMSAGITSSPREASLKKNLTGEKKPLYKAGG